MKLRLKNNSNKIVLIVFILFIYNILIPIKAFGEVRVLKIAGDNNFPPYEYISDHGLYTGFNIDIMRAVAIEMGIEIELIPMPWNEAVEALKNGEVDAIQGITNTKERDIIFNFTEPTTINSQNIFVLNDNYYITDLKSLEGRKVSYQKGDISETFLKKYPKIQGIPMNNQQEAIGALLDNKADAFLGSKLTGLYYIQCQNQLSKVKIVGNPVDISKYGPATLKGNKEVYTILDEGIRKIKENGIYNKIYKKWFGEEFIKGTDYTKITYFLTIILSIVTGLIIIIIFINRKLKKMVDLRTNELIESNLALKKSELKFRTIFEQAPFGISLTDSITGSHYKINERYAEITGRSIDELLNTNWMEITHPEDIQTDLDMVNLLYKNEMKDYNMKKRYIKPDGSIVWVNMRNTTFTIDDNSGVKHLCMIEDITEQKLLEEKLEYLSFHDTLTGLYNRRFIEEELKRLDNENNYPLTMIIADVNGLKLINDSFGHNAGDELLTKVAKILKKSCRPNDIIARLGGDEFIIILPKTTKSVTSQIVKNLREIASHEKVEAIEISISFGYESKNNLSEDINEVFKKAEDYMYKEKLFESPSMRGKTINVIIKTLHEKNKREELHSHRVSKLCQSMGEALGFDKSRVEELKNAGLLHDIGKVAIAENILNKPEKLTSEEWELIIRHPEIGYRILSTVDGMIDIAKYVLCHHERINGSGYPKGLKGEEIPLQSKIISIADAYDAMTSKRSYREALSRETAISELLKNSGTQFDENLIKIFIDKVAKEDRTDEH